jgi:hypothetical protein
VAVPGLPCARLANEGSAVVSGQYDLVILAAGMGSRFGGLKQVQPVGPAGELIIEYSVYDALRAGFSRLVLVIRRDIEAEFRATIGRRLESRMEVSYVFQETDRVGANPLPRGISNRTKPWGTAHAVLAARDAVRGPFAVINADDFYGAAGYLALARHFAASPDYALVGYPLKQTLSDFGTVSRGVCAIDGDGRLRSITELTGIGKTAAGVRYADAAGTTGTLTGDEIVSMNFWGFTPGVFPQLERLFAAFLAGNAGDPKAEFYLPTAISTLNERGEARVALLRSRDAWFGLTHRDPGRDRRGPGPGRVAAPAPARAGASARRPRPSSVLPSRMRGIIHSGLPGGAGSRCSRASAGRSSASRAWARLKRKSSLSGCCATSAANCADRMLSRRTGPRRGVVQAAALVGAVDELGRRLGFGGRCRDPAISSLGDKAGDAVAAEQVAVVGQDGVGGAFASSGGGWPMQRVRALRFSISMADRLAAGGPLLQLVLDGVVAGELLEDPWCAGARRRSRPRGRCAA